MFAEDKCLGVGKFCEKTGLSVIRLDSISVGVAAAAGKSSYTTRRPTTASRMTISRR